MKTVHGLILLLVLSYTYTHAVFYVSGVWQDPETKHAIIAFGDVHEAHKDTRMQQYELIKGASSIPNAHIIVEDIASKHWVLFALGVETTDGAEISLDFLHQRALAYDIKSSNVEFRPYYTHCIPAFLYAAHIIKNYKRIKQADTFFEKDHQNIVGIFRDKELPILRGMSRFPLNIKAYNKIRESYDNEAYYPFGEGKLLELDILKHISEDRKKKQTSIVISGSFHTVGIAPIIERAGYACMSYKINNKNAPRNLKSIFQDTVEPVNVPQVYQDAKRSCQLGTLSSTTLRSRLVDSALRYCVFSEKNWLRHANYIAVQSLRLGLFAGSACMAMYALSD